MALHHTHNSLAIRGLKMKMSNLFSEHKINSGNSGNETWQFSMLLPGLLTTLIRQKDLRTNEQWQHSTSSDIHLLILIM